MFSQSLLLAAWRETAAPPDSSARSQAETTPESSPVSAASRLANVCWAEVSIVPAWAGRLALPAPAAAVVPVRAPASCEENDIDAPIAPEEDDVPVVLAVVLADGVNAVDRLESSELIIATRAVTSEMLIF